MNILLIGSGGREHALAWKLCQSPQVKSLFTLPGNPGTALHGVNLPLSLNDHKQIAAAALEYHVDLVVIGPETPLAEGLSDSLRAAGLRVFGPSQAAARIESSKAFAKAFMLRHNIPTAYGETFENLESALDYLESVEPGAIVIKASGLAAGKGVYLPESREEARAILTSLLEQGSLGEAGRQVLIEERLHGPEVSLLAFTDGISVMPMPPVQDHKRLADGDRGPNTGGMGTLAPNPACPPELVQQVKSTILQPAIDGLRQEGSPFCGVLYAGLILTSEGPSVLEFNCRFGDPETQVLMPMLQSDLIEVIEACVERRLAAQEITWHTGGAACVVLAAPGYPEKPVTGQAISGLVDGLRGMDFPPNTWAFLAGTVQKNGCLNTAGGRVLGITATAGSVAAAVEKAYAAVKGVQFEGMHYRRDIGRETARPVRSIPDKKPTAYEQAGVSIAAGSQAVLMMRGAVRSTFTPQVLSDVGAFGGLYDANLLKEMDSPVLVASTDGVGTKVDLAARTGSYANLGRDLVNHCINDILVQGARPLFFLDYIASDRLDPQMVAEVVKGVSAACREAGCALLGGETAEMPGVYAAGHFDIAGTIVGQVERSAILPQEGIQPGDQLVGLRSSGPHTNGYSLVRRLFADTPLDTVYPELGVPLFAALLEPHRSYLPLLTPALFYTEPSPVLALAHLTGGGFIDNIPRVLPAGCGAQIQLGSWPIPPLFRIIQRAGEIAEEEMHQVFNMGIGMVAVVHPGDVERFCSRLPEPTWVIGEVVEGQGVQLIKEVE